MTQILGQNFAGTSASADNPLTLWGYSASEMHDLYWLAREIAVVRCGAKSPLPSDARLFMLISDDRLYRLQLRPLLDRMFWMPHSIYFIGFNSSAKLQPNKNGAGYTRLAVTPHRQIAEYWRICGVTENIWMRLRRQFPDFCAMRIPGIAYAKCGSQAMDYLHALAHDWPDPEIAIPGIARLAHRVHGPTGFDMSMLKNHTRPLWIGLRSSAGADSTAGILPDAVPDGTVAISNTGRNP